MRIRWFLMVAATFVAGPSGAAGADDPAAKLHGLFEDRLEWVRRESPEWAMAKGDYRYADRITDESLQAIERRHRETREHLQRLEEIDRAGLNEDDRLNYDLFGLTLRNSVESHRFRTYLVPLGPRHGPHQDIAQMAERVRFDDFEDYENYLKRLGQVPGAVDHVIERMRIGLEEVRTIPKVIMHGLGGQFEALLTKGGLEALAEPLARMPDTISAEQAKSIKQRFGEKVMPAVRRALERLGTFVTVEYIPGCRETIAASDLPDGEAYYRFSLRRFTTTDMTAGQIHELGLSEVARIRKEMMAVIRSSDFMEKHDGAGSLADDALFKSFLTYLRTDPRFYFTEGEELLRGYRDICKRADAWLPKLFGKLPRLSYGVRAVPDFMAPNQTTAYYWSGDIRNAEPGWFYANTYALDQRPKYEMTALALHEAVPGHHLQIALAQELENVPEFRREIAFTAFVEGWGLYAERLGLEMDMYDDPYDNFGRLIYEMWRACRLVVDTGMHALDWSRDRAMGFMSENTALKKLNITAEVDRYIGWPGQATAYKVGELKFRELRDAARRKLGERFDLRAFHDAVLGAGPLPLNILEQRMTAWIDGQARDGDDSG